MESNNFSRILKESSYWVEGINGLLYNSILDYMEKNNLNRTQLAKELGLSKGRISQILNDGEINFSIEKLVEISLKINMFPILKFEDCDSYIDKLTFKRSLKKLKVDHFSHYSTEIYDDSTRKNKPKIIKLSSYNKFHFAI